MLAEEVAAVAVAVAEEVAVVAAEEVAAVAKATVAIRMRRLEGVVNSSTLILSLIVA